MNWLRVVSTILLVTSAADVYAQAAGADAQPSQKVPIFSAPAPPPEKSAPLIWFYRETNEATSGRWYSDDQIDRNATRIWYLENALAEEKGATERKAADARLAEAGLVLGMPKWFWITAGTLVGIGIGVGIGYAVWHGGGSTTTATTAQPLAYGAR